MTSLANGLWRSRLEYAWTGAAGGLSAAALAVAVGMLTVREPTIGFVGAAFILALGLTLAEPALIPLLSVPVILAVPRVGAGALDLSVSDAALFVATWPAVFLGARPYSRTMRNLLWGIAAYEALTFLSVINHPYRANLVEWVHQLFLLAGAIIVGWAIGRRGLAATAYSLLVLAGIVLTTSALVEAAQLYGHGSFDPVYLRWPWAMHKNALGTTMAMIAIGLYARPGWLPWGRRLRTWVTVYLCLGLAVSQSRQAVIGFAVMVVVIAFRDGRRRSIGWLTLLAAGSVTTVSLLVRGQFESNNEHNSAFQRLQWYSASLDVWRESPWLGLGNRWWYVTTNEFRFQPPQVFVEVLTTTGVVGLIAFVALMGTLLYQLWRMPTRYGLIGFVAIGSRIVQGQFDIFWLAVQSSLPFLIAGLTLGAHEHHRERERPVDAEGPSQAPVQAVA